MWVVTWNTNEKHFDDVHKAHQFAMQLVDDGVCCVKMFKEPFNR